MRREGILESWKRDRYWEWNELHNLDFKYETHDMKFGQNLLAVKVVYADFSIWPYSVYFLDTMLRSLKGYLLSTKMGR